MLAGEGSTAQAVQMGELVGLAPALQLAAHHGQVGMAVRDLVGQDMPDDDQELARDRHHGLALAQGGDQACELSVPVGMVFHRAPGCFDEHRTELTATLLGDGSGMLRLPRRMDAGTQPAVADQFFG